MFEGRWSADAVNGKVNSSSLKLITTFFRPSTIDPRPSTMDPSSIC
jgi:hypothetical protein